MLQVQLVVWDGILPILVSSFARGKVKGSVMCLCLDLRAASRCEIQQGRRGFILALINSVKRDWKKSYKLIKKAPSHML